jgi:hypothetical protein
MMAGRYSGNLVRSWASAEESANFAPDPRHGVRNEPEPYPTTDQVYADTGAEYIGTEMPVDVAVGGGTVLGTPSRSHDGLAGRHQVYTDDQHRESLKDRHGPDGQRRVVAHKYVLPPTQDAREVYSDEYEESHDQYGTPNNTGAVAAMRGIDGNPQNNPEGIRRGWERRGPWLDSDRRLGRRRYLYQPQPLAERQHYVPVDQPQPPLSGPDILPFKLFKEAGTVTGFKRPALFRAPRSVDSTLIAEPSDGYGQVAGGEVI